MISRFADPDYQLVWPRTLFVAEAMKLLNRVGSRNWNDRCELLLEHAFISGYVGGPLSEFRDAGSPWGSPTISEPEFLQDLVDNADQLQEDRTSRRPLWRERKTGQRTFNMAILSKDDLVREFIILMNDLDTYGYFEKHFGKDCVDDPREDAPHILMRRELGVDNVWPLEEEQLAKDMDLFFDIVELLHDISARPLTRHLHDYAGCGWHHSNFDIDSGRTVYRWRVNRLLARTDLGLQLAEEGEDIGRLVTAVDDARTDLVYAVAARADDGPADQVRHALALFRARGADRNQKRSAIASLALVLEERRHDVLTEALSKSDRGAIFDLANNFHIRHQDARQRREYDDFYLDWIFWLYLSTAELTNRIIDQQAKEVE